MWQSYLGHTSAKFCGRWCCTQHCSRHNLPHKRQSMHICHVQQQHNFITYTLICHTDPALLMHSTASAYKTDHICHSQLQQPYTIAYTIHIITAKNKLHSYKITSEWLLQFHVSLNCMVSTMKIIHRCTTSIMHAPHNSLKLH